MSHMSNQDIGERNTGITESLLKIHEGLKKEKKIEFIIQELVHSREEKPYRSEQEDGITMAQREKLEEESGDE